MNPTMNGLENAAMDMSGRSAMRLRARGDEVARSAAGGHSCVCRDPRAPPLAPLAGGHLRVVRPPAPKRALRRRSGNDERP